MEPFYFPFYYKIMLREHNRKKETVLNVNLKQFTNTAFISNIKPEEGRGVKILFCYILFIFAVFQFIFAVF